MSDCCAAVHPHKRRCPGHGGECAEVPVRTLTLHLRTPWQQPLDAARYFFCDDPACAVVYFGDDGAVIDQSQLRTPVGIKDASDDGLLCYCYGVARGEARRDPVIRDYVVAQTRAGACACDVRNPSGRCCLKDFPAA